MKKLLARQTLVVVSLIAALMVPAVVQAQGPGGGGRGGPGRSAKMRLGGLVRGIGELERARRAPLTKDQAKKVTALVKPWRSKPKMTESDARTLYTKMNAVLTTRQKNELDRMSALRRRNGRGGPGGPGGRRGGSGGPGGPGRGGPSGGPRGGAPGGGGFNPQQMRQRMQQMQGFFQTYNPFYPPGNYQQIKSMPAPMRQGWTRRYQETAALLNNLAKKAR